ncbi:MAG: GNA1162 family protein [Pseudomonadota bacterium]
MKHLKVILLGVILVFISIGCVPGIPHTLVPDYQSKIPTSVAVLPVQNETVDMDAPQLFRPKLLNIICYKGYVSPSVEEIDSKLAEKDIREAGQLNTMSPQEIGKLLNVDAVLYSTVTDWSTTFLVVYASIKVGARFQLIDTKTGEQLWESQHIASEKKFGTDKDAITQNVGFAALKRYDPYAQAVINMSFSTLPNGHKYAPPAMGSCLAP